MHIKIKLHVSMLIFHNFVYFIKGCFLITKILKIVTSCKGDVICLSDSNDLICWWLSSRVTWSEFVMVGHWTGVSKYNAVVTTWHKETEAAFMAFLNTYFAGLISIFAAVLNNRSRTKQFLKGLMGYVVVWLWLIISTYKLCEVKFVLVSFWFWKTISGSGEATEVIHMTSRFYVLKYHPS